jgi:hypothetical protein
VALEHVQGYDERIQIEAVVHRFGATKLLVKGGARVLGTHRPAASTSSCSPTTSPFVRSSSESIVCRLVNPEPAGQRDWINWHMIIY